MNNTTTPLATTAKAEGINGNHTPCSKQRDLVRSDKKRAFTQCAAGIAKNHISVQSNFIYSKKYLLTGEFILMRYLKKIASKSFNDYLPKYLQ
ncbi:hypothetical protein A6770_30380 [Nostoc minutum NIES-26]|uniref:Transposase n=1 Tax=Nostoc minutum NIES-26 TaxID=1844469 RepID=A0A367QBA8_9NOSO|nr:hypothetical protein A6770_30380 [Nostoc minutum NIES-26]